MLAKFSWLNPKGPYLNFKKKTNVCVLFTYSMKGAREIRKFNVAVMQQRPKSVMHVQSCTDFLLFSLPSPSLLLKLPIVVIQTFCCHGNVTSHFLPSISRITPVIGFG